jgi:hypothetical protein
MWLERRGFDHDVVADDYRLFHDERGGIERRRLDDERPG